MNPNLINNIDDNGDTLLMQVIRPLDDIYEYMQHELKFIIE